MANPFLMRISVSPENLQKLNRGEKVVWSGIAHPELTIELVPLTPTKVENKSEPAIQIQAVL